MTQKRKINYTEGQRHEPTNHPQYADITRSPWLTVLTIYRQYPQVHKQQNTKIHTQLHQIYNWTINNIINSSVITTLKNVRKGSLMVKRFHLQYKKISQLTMNDQLNHFWLSKQNATMN